MTDFDDALTVTVGEVRAAVARVLLNQDYTDAGEGQVVAERVIADIMAHREREWRIGDIVRSDGGIVWARAAAGRWHRMGKPGLYSHERPARPLTLLDSPQDRKDQERHLAGLEPARNDGAPI